MILASFRDFAKSELPDVRLLELDARDEMPIETIRRMCGPELGIHLVFVPEEYGGMGAGAFDVYRVCEELARLDIGIATGLLATCLGSEPIRIGGTPAQRAHWFGRIAKEGLLMAYGATEPGAGSDLAALRTTATPVVESGSTVGYRLQGSKQWISNGGVADACTILANAPGGPTWFVVDPHSPGFSAGRPENKHGIRASNTAALSLDGVVVEPDRLVSGVEGQGLLQAQAVFGYTRLMVAAFGLGAGWAALDRAIAYSRERVQAGAPLSEKQGYTHKLIAPHAVRLETARAFVEETAERLDGAILDEPMNTDGAIAKYLATEAGNAAADAAIQALGGYGYTREYGVEKIRRDVRVTTIYEGTSEIMEMTIARDRWQQHLKTRGCHYHDRALELEALHASQPEVGAQFAALGLHALGEVMERMRVHRLTRHQHLLMRLGELAALAEGAAAAARRAARSATNKLPDKSEPRLSSAGLGAIARCAGRGTALRIACEGLQWVHGSAGFADEELGVFESALGLSAIKRAQGGMLADLDALSDALYGRVASAAGG